MMSNKKAIVIGAGIVGLATARALAIKGYSVTVIERNHQAVGASIRNFGMIWPIGQPAGKLYNRAMRSRQVWQEVCTGAGLWNETSGSLHLAYHGDEMQVLAELYEIFTSEGRAVQLLEAPAVTRRYPGVNPAGLLGGLYSDSEMLVDPRECINAIPAWLAAQYGIVFLWGKCASFCSDHTVYIGNEAQYEADLIFICSGADFETLYPEHFDALPLTRCKLQMMRLVAQPDSKRLGASLCGGLSLVHYNSFKAAPSLAALHHRYEKDMPDYLRAGIHVMVAQNGRGELTVGDSHEYGNSFDPFDRQEINRLILGYLQNFVQCKEWKLIETWNGIYPKLTNGATEVFLSPEKGVYILNGLGGAGMTLSFGLAEEVVNGIY